MKEGNVKISVIVPVYNVEKYIKQCMDSLVNQTFENYEIIVVNDGTPDGSMDYVFELQKQHDNIIVINRMNGGQSAARNSGLECAKGDYILFCDSDDSLDQNALKLLYSEVVKENLDVILFDAKLFSRVDGGWLENSNNPYNRRDIDENVIAGAEMYVKLIMENKFSCSPCLYLISRDVIIKNRLKFYEGIIHEDELFTPILFILAGRVKHKNWLLYNRYEREGSTTRSNNFSKRADGMYVVIQELDKWRAKCVSIPEVKVALEKAIKQHIQHILVYYANIHKLTKIQKEQRKQIITKVRDNKWKFGVLFKLYLIKQRMKTCIAIIL